MKKISLLLFLAFIISCKQRSKEKKERETFFPVLSYIKSQVAHVDTSLYSIIKVTWTDSIHTDTTYIKREEFRELAKDFLELPDLSDKKYQDIYTEDKFYDEGMNKVFITYRPKNTNAAVIQRQEVVINKEDVGDKVSNFIINMVQNFRDSSIEKELLWRIDNSFNVITSVQKPGQPEITRRFKVVWE